MALRRIGDLRRLLESVDLARMPDRGGAALWTARLVLLREDAPLDPGTPPSDAWRTRAEELAADIRTGLASSGLHGLRLAALGQACIGLGWSELALQVFWCLVGEAAVESIPEATGLVEFSELDLVPPLLALLLHQGRRADVEIVLEALAPLGETQRRLVHRWRALLASDPMPSGKQARNDRVLTFLRWRSLDEPTHYLDWGHWDE